MQPKAKIESYYSEAGLSLDREGPLAPRWLVRRTWLCCARCGCRPAPFGPRLRCAWQS